MTGAGSAAVQGNGVGVAQGNVAVGPPHYPTPQMPTLADVAQLRMPGVYCCYLCPYLANSEGNGYCQLAYWNRLTVLGHVELDHLRRENFANELNTIIPSVDVQACIFQISEEALPLTNGFRPVLHDVAELLQKMEAEMSHRTKRQTAREVDFMNNAWNNALVPEGFATHGPADRPLDKSWKPPSDMPTFFRYHNEQILRTKQPACLLPALLAKQLIYNRDVCMDLTQNSKLSVAAHPQIPNWAALRSGAEPMAFDRAYVQTYPPNRVREADLAGHSENISVYAMKATGHPFWMHAFVSMRLSGDRIAGQPAYHAGRRLPASFQQPPASGAVKAKPAGKNHSGSYYTDTNACNVAEVCKAVRRARFYLEALYGCRKPAEYNAYLRELTAEQGGRDQVKDKISGDRMWNGFIQKHYKEKEGNSVLVRIQNAIRAKGMTNPILDSDRRMTSFEQLLLDRLDDTSGDALHVVLPHNSRNGNTLSKRAKATLLCPSCRAKTNERKISTLMTQQPNSNHYAYQARCCDNTLSSIVLQNFLELRFVKQTALLGDMALCEETRQAIADSDVLLRQRNPQDSLASEWKNSRVAIDGILQQTAFALDWRNNAVIDEIQVADPTKWAHALFGSIALSIMHGKVYKLNSFGKGETGTKWAVFDWLVEALNKQLYQSAKELHDTDTGRHSDAKVKGLQNAEDTKFIYKSCPIVPLRHYPARYVTFTNLGHAVGMGSLKSDKSGTPLNSCTVSLCMRRIINEKLALMGDLEAETPPHTTSQPEDHVCSSRKS